MGREEYKTHHATKSLFYAESKELNNDKDAKDISRWAHIFNKKATKSDKKQKN